MKTQSLHGLALILGTLATLMTMAFHPVGTTQFSLENAINEDHMNVMVHALGIVSLPFIAFGYLGIFRRTGFDKPLPLVALITFCFSAVAVMIAAIASGLIMSSIVNEMVGVNAVAQQNFIAWLDYTHHINQACAKVFSFGISLATVLWSCSLLSLGGRERSIGILGIVVGSIIFAGVLAGHLRMDVHGFGAIVLMQALWAIALGISMMMENRNAIDGQPLKQYVG